MSLNIDQDQKDWFALSNERVQTFLQSFFKFPYNLESMTVDMAPRYYYRVIYEGQTYVLLESAPDGHSQSLPGHEIGDFIKIQTLLKVQGVRVPEIYHVDEAQGLVLLEDFGDRTFETVLEGITSYEKRELYLQATDLLNQLSTLPQSSIAILPDFSVSRINSCVRRFVDWFLPYYYDRPVLDDEIEAFLNMIKSIEKETYIPTEKFVHGDFHPSNLMILPDASLGILDFQGAMKGNGVYDLVNLLHDARRNVDKDIIEICQKVYSKYKKNDITDCYNYFSLHFHLRVIGQFIRVALVSGKANYLQHLDRLRVYLSQNDIPIFNEYCQQSGVNFNAPLPELDLERVKGFIRSDAA